MNSTFGFVVTGEEKIHCAGCEARISKALKRLAGVREVQASAKDQRVVVTVDRAMLGPDRVRARLEELGYEVTQENT